MQERYQNGSLIVFLVNDILKNKYLTMGGAAKVDKYPPSINL